MSQATESLATYVRGVSKDTVVVTRRGKPVAALVPLRSSDLESVALATNPTFRKILEKSRRSLRAGKGLTLEEVEQRLR
jgi:prevent-host-death family protein